MLPSIRCKSSKLPLTFAALVFGPVLSSFAFQEPKDAKVLPGLYEQGPCVPAPFPNVLPAVNDVLDSAALTRVLGDGALDKTLILSLRLGSLESDPRVRLFGKPESADVTRHIVDAVLSALRPVPPDTPWAFRLQLEPGALVSMSLSRSELCPPALKKGPERTQSFRMEEGQFVQMQQRLAEEARLREMVVFRVLVQPNGKAGDVITVSASGDRRIDNQMQQSVTRGSYFPATLDGASVPAWLQVGKPH